tara:strand:+ start:1529 stop:1789 length:261 start_codon:yes stop_codon:yes gene_type:complete
MDYKITLTDTEVKGLEYIAIDPNEWITNAARSRASVAVAEIISINTAYCNANSIGIEVGEAAQVAQAYKLGIVKTVADRNKESESS